MLSISFIKSGVSIFGVNGSAIVCELLQDIGFYNFYGKQYIEIPAKELPIGIIIAGNSLWKGGVNDTGNPAIDSIYYLPTVCSNNSISTGLNTVRCKSVPVGQSSASNGFSGYTDNTATGIFQKPTYSNGRVKINLSGSDYYFYPYQYSAGRVHVVLLYLGIIGTYYNQNIPL